MIENLRCTLREIIEIRQTAMRIFSHRIQAIKTGPNQQHITEEIKSKTIKTFANNLIVETTDQSILNSIITIQDFLELWLNDSENITTRRYRTSFIQLMKKSDPAKKYPYRSPINFAILNNNNGENEEQMFCSLNIIINRTRKMIKTMNISANSKNTYFGYLERLECMLENFLLGMEKILWAPLCIDHPSLTIQTIGSFLDFLEQAALKSASIRPYKALLLCRALIYAPLPAQKLFALTAPNEQNSSLECEGREFPVTRTFIKLWKCFNEKHLFPNSLRTYRDPEQYLNLTIKRLSRRAKLPICLTPTMLRLVRETYFPKNL